MQEGVFFEKNKKGGGAAELPKRVFTLKGKKTIHWSATEEKSEGGVGDLKGGKKRLGQRSQKVC